MFSRFNLYKHDKLYHSVLSEYIRICFVYFKYIYIELYSTDLFPSTYYESNYVNGGLAYILQNDLSSWTLV